MTVAVIFELTPAPGRTQEYLDLAAGLADEVSKFDGFISIERFESITRPGNFVSLSYWRDYTLDERAEAPKDSRGFHGERG